MTHSTNLERSWPILGTQQGNSTHRSSLTFYYPMEGALKREKNSIVLIKRWFLFHGRNNCVLKRKHLKKTSMAASASPTGEMQGHLRHKSSRFPYQEQNHLLWLCKRQVKIVSLFLNSSKALLGLTLTWQMQAMPNSALLSCFLSASLVFSFVYIKDIP